MSEAVAKKPYTGKPVVTQEAEFISERMGMIINAILEDKQQERISAFNREKTDEDRFSFVWAMPQLHEVIQLEEEYTGKSSTDAAKFRAKGNKYFQNKSYLSSIDSYNKSIVQAPVWQEGKGENELALSYGNRSAALFHLKRYKHCLEDISLAIEAGYPADSYYKLHDRQAKCYLAMADTQNAKIYFTKALENVEKSPLDERIIMKWKENIAQQMVYCEGSGTNSAEVEESPSVSSQVPTVTPPMLDSHPLLSANTKVDYDQNHGRHLVARNDIHVGEVLCVEKPFASVLYQEHYETHCYMCLLKTNRYVPCTQCSTIVFCSPECRQQAWEQHHQYECKHFVLFDKIICARIGQLAAQMVLKMGLPYLLEYVRNQKNITNSEKDVPREQHGMGRDAVYHSDYHSVYHLTTHSADRFPINLFDYTVMAAFLTKTLLATGFFRQGEVDYSSTENIHLVGSTLLRHLQVIQCNSQHVQEAVQGCQFDQRGNMMVTGVALYPTLSLVNHSCDPVTDFNAYGDRMVLRALRNIYAGEPVTVSYGPVYYDQDVKQRRQLLQECYFFQCDCPPCTEYWPTVTQLEDCTVYFRCQGCHEILDVTKNPYSKTVECEECKMEMNMEQVTSQLELSHENVFTKGMVNAFCGHYEKAAEKFQEHLTLLQNHLCQPWRDFTSCQLCLKQCYRLMASQ